MKKAEEAKNTDGSRHPVLGGRSHISSLGAPGPHVKSEREGAQAGLEGPWGARPQGPAELYQTQPSGGGLWDSRA